MCTTCPPISMTFSFRVTMNNAPRLATILSTFRGSLNGFSNLAEVNPYTELIAIFNACAKFLSSSSGASAYSANAPLNNVFNAALSLCLIAILASTKSLKIAVYLSPNMFNAIALCGCIEATSNVFTCTHIPWSAHTYPPSPTSSP